MQGLREVVAQLRADDERLRQEQVAAVPGPSTAPPVSLTPASSTASAPLTERLIFVPRDRKCPTFRGKSGIGLTEWLEEVQACMRARHLSTSDQVFFLFDHLEGKAREEIKYRSSRERSDPDVLQELYGCVESYVAFFYRRSLFLPMAARRRDPVRVFTCVDGSHDICEAARTQWYTQCRGFVT